MFGSGRNEALFICLTIRKKLGIKDITDAGRLLRRQTKIGNEVKVQGGNSSCIEINGK